MTIVKTTFVFLASFLSLGLQAKTSETWMLKTSHAEYTAKHLAHNTRGKSQSAKGKIECSDLCRGLLAIEMKSFDSENSNRDLHMQEITHAAQHPYVTLRLEGPRDTTQWNEKNVTGKVQLSGTEKPIQFQSLKVAKVAGELKMQATFVVSLTEFGVERPSLLGVSVDDNVELAVSGAWSSSL